VFWLCGVEVGRELKNFIHRGIGARKKIDMVCGIVGV